MKFILTSGICALLFAGISFADDQSLSSKTHEEANKAESSLKKGGEDVKEGSKKAYDKTKQEAQEAVDATKEGAHKAKVKTEQGYDDVKEKMPGSDDQKKSY